MFAFQEFYVKKRISSNETSDGYVDKTCSVIYSPQGSHSSNCFVFPETLSTNRATSHQSCHNRDTMMDFDDNSWNATGVCFFGMPAGEVLHLVLVKSVIKTIYMYMEHLAIKDLKRRS